MEFINIFVYGTLKRGNSNHDLFCENMVRCVCGTVLGELYDTGYGFPALDLNGNNKVYGEIITIPKEDLFYFDKLEGVPNLYQRNEVYVNVGEEKIKTFVYTMDCSKKNFKIIKGGTW